jgi:hypothetical protein
LKALLLTFTCFILPAAAFAKPPAEIANRTGYVKKLFEETSSSDYRVQLMLIPGDVFIDPPPDAATFTARAKLILTIESGAGFDHIHDVVRAIEKSEWKEQQLPHGYPRAYWRLAGPWESALLDLLVDEENSSVGHGGKWYRVDRALVTMLTRGCVDVAMKVALKDRQSTGSTTPKR